MARLTISGPGGARDVVLGERLTIGRVEGVDLVLDDKGISRKHCELERKGDGYVARDLGSSNGTLVNGEKITEQPLADGDRVRVGGLTLTFHVRDADCVLRFGEGEHAGRELALTGERTTLGRRPENAIPFVDVKVSGVHLEVVRDGDGFVLRDLGSTNGTFLDGRKVSTEVALSHGDRVKFGANEFTFVDLRRGAVPAADGVAASAASATLALPPKRGKAGALVGLAAVVVAVGGAAAWYFQLDRAGGAPTSGKQVPPAPAGTLLVEDWSFEESGSSSELWGAEIGDGFSARRGRAASGSFALAASVESGHAVASRRKKIDLASPRGLRVTGQLAADDGVLGSVTLRFAGAPDEEGNVLSWSVVVARSSGGSGFTAFSSDITPPAWAKSVELLVLARGAGSVAIDDLAVVPGGEAPAGTKMAELTLAPRGPDAWYLDHHAPLVELFAPFGSGTVAPAEATAAVTHLELPPGAFAAAVNAQGATFTLKPGSGPLAAAGFAALVVADTAAQGVTLLTAVGSDRRFGAFDATEVRKLFLGAAAERVELGFSSPAHVVGVARGNALRLEIATPAELIVTLRAGFEAEGKEAGQLYAKAQAESRAGHAGTALAHLREIRDRLPHDDTTAELARKLEAEIVPKLEAEIAAIDLEATGAEFLGSLDHYRRTLKRADDLLAQAEGLDAARDLKVRAERMRATVAVLERERHEDEARRLLRLARAYEAQKSPAPPRATTAAELLAELQRSYADTAAAREARGEAPPNSDTNTEQGGNR